MYAEVLIATGNCRNEAHLTCRDILVFRRYHFDDRLSNGTVNVDIWLKCYVNSAHIV